MKITTTRRHIKKKYNREQKRNEQTNGDENTFGLNCQREVRDGEIRE